jgi:hypothetical protein
MESSGAALGLPPTLVGEGVSAIGNGAAAISRPPPTRAGQSHMAAVRAERGSVWPVDIVRLIDEYEAGRKRNVA